ncbi:hypothetical protein Ga0102493_112071 [Erythrobacter litoralis]|jgi:hypothetical protein|uniref:Uncharacterized protein n=1 Tax=Erythrobacter litoralis TaxID=39960 RepID=A0A074MJQ9_9SPHN|nr:hypothetical protein [Erythrobacter litoralis]AOL23090.1 hypothetical protein Ga0102493_112071 [Erythrobacter litoralis]KEO93045.1 hypothetical protein EH32_12520 [Erythrobacter litoralis]MEE4339324.1 hypothetical protein [Erythrobacter sp.]
MPKRQSRHPDNDLIDRMTEEKTPSQQSSSGGEVNRRVGKRDETKSATDPDNREPEIGSDNPEDDARKGPKTMNKIKQGKQDG